jgi:hypothetical protein
MAIELLRVYDEEATKTAVTSYLSEGPLDLTALCLKLQNDGFQIKDAKAGPGAFAGVVLEAVNKLKDEGKIVKEGKSYKLK